MSGGACSDGRRHPSVDAGEPGFNLALRPTDTYACLCFIAFSPLSQPSWPVCWSRPSAFAAGRAAHDDSSRGAGNVSFSSAVYQINENAGQFAVTVNRTGDLGKPEVVYYGVTNKSSAAGNNFDKIGNSELDFAPGQSSATFNVTIHDQGINGPMRTARAYLYGAHPQHLGSPSQAELDLLQNDPLDTKDAENPLGYPQVPTDGDPLQFVNWYIFGPQSPAGAAIGHYSSNPAWAQALHTIAYSPGSGTYRFWMWNQPAATLASTVEKYLADAEVAQPNTTVALSTYSLVHGACESPKAIKSRYENWITQLAHGIGNFRVVIYLEEDSLIETHCLSHGAIETRLQELAYAVKALSADPHALVYMDAGAPDGWISAAQDRAIPEAGGHRAGAGLLRERHAQRLDHHRHPLRAADRAHDRRQALHRADRRQRPWTARADGPQGQRQRGSLQPARTRRRPAQLEHGLRLRRWLPVVQQPGQLRRPLRRGRSAGRTVLGALRGGSRPARDRQVTGPQFNLQRSNTNM